MVIRGCAGRAFVLFWQQFAQITLNSEHLTCQSQAGCESFIPREICFFYCLPKEKHERLWMELKNSMRNWQISAKKIPEERKLVEQCKWAQYNPTVSYINLREGDGKVLILCPKGSVMTSCMVWLSIHGSKANYAYDLKLCFLVWTSSDSKSHIIYVVIQISSVNNCVAEYLLQ